MTTTSKRKPNSIFDEQVKSINSFGIGSIYKVKDMRNRMSVGKYNTERVGDYHLDLLSTKCIKRVKRGYYEVVGFIPSFLTLNMCEANRGYTTTGPNPKYLGKTDKYGQNGCYDEWYVNNERPTMQVQRGKKWKLGEPNPFAVEIIEEPKKEEVVTTGKERLVHCIVHCISTFNVVAVCNNENVIVLAINPSDNNYAICANAESGLKRLILITELYSIYLKEKPDTKHTIKDEIVDILKQGLSANDAADKILNLF